MRILEDVAVRFESSVGTMPVKVWSAPGVNGRAPALLVLDASDYFRGRLLDVLYDQVTAGHVRPMRVFAVDTVLSDNPYQRFVDLSASPEFCSMIATGLIPKIREQFPTDEFYFLGGSLGALTGLRIHLEHSTVDHPVFAGLMLQSGSFFDYLHPGLSEAQARRVLEFSDRVKAGGYRPLPVPVKMTSGQLEDNQPLIAKVVEALEAQDYPVSLYEYYAPWEQNRGGHDANWWVPALVPGGLVEMIGK